MVRRLEELVNPPADDKEPGVVTPEAEVERRLVGQVHPQNYAGLITKVRKLLTVAGEKGDPLQRDMGEMANKILQQADTIRLAMADLKVKEDTAAHSRRLAEKQFITRNELERDELAYQSQASKVTIAWNDLELLINYTLQRDKIEFKQNLENAELELDYTRVLSPVNGVVTDPTPVLGSYASPGEPVVTLVNTDTWRVVAYFRETQLRHIRPGQPARVQLPAYPGVHFEGIVQGVSWGVEQQDGATGPEGLPSVDPTVDWVRMAQRFPVRITLPDDDPAHPLRKGMRAKVRIDTTAEAGGR